MSQLDRVIDTAVALAVEEKGRDLTSTEVNEIEQEFIQACKEYPDHHPLTARLNYRAGREIWDTNGDMRRVSA